MMKRISPVWILVVLSLLVYGANFWGTSIYILDEAKNAGCAMEMWQEKNWIVPYFNNELRTDKPPLHYYFMMAAYQFFGVSPFSARLFSVLAGVALVCVVFLFVRKLVNESTAWWSALGLVASLQMAIQFHLAVPDPYLIFFLTTGLLSFFYGYTQRKPRYLYLFYFCCALAFLSKGLIAVVFPGLIILAYWLMTGGLSLQKLKDAQLLPGALIFLLTGLPWYVAVGIETNGAWLHGFFIEHNVQRYTSTMEGHRGFWGAPFVILVAATLPGSVFVVQAVRMVWRGRTQNPFLLFCLIAIVAIAGFFTFSKTILPSYPAPAVPFLAILLGHFISARAASVHRPSDWVSLSVHLLIAAAIPFAAWFALGQEAGLRHLQPIAATFGVLPAAAVPAIFFWRTNRTAALYLLGAGWMALAMVFFWWANPALDKSNPIRMGRSLISPQTEVVYFESMNPAYVFAFRRTVPRVSAEDIRQMANDGRAFTVLTREKHIAELEALGLDSVYCRKDLFENPVSCILSHSPATAR
jgi:4-amino-4-deoxy-L-arabinose transferase-like glycosyltransferase